MTMTPSGLPESIVRLLGDHALSADSLGRSQSQVYRCGNVYLKIDALGSLRRAALMQEYFQRKGLSAPLLDYVQEGGRDYLLVEAVRGRYACDAELMRNPERLADRLGEAIRALHEVDARDCPLSDVNEQAIQLFVREHGGERPENVGVLKKDALVHGDCCLPNVFFDENGFSGFIDLGESGLGDTHFDLYWAQWSLTYNLQTDQYNDRFLDAYGRDRIDQERMSLCALLSGK